MFSFRWDEASKAFFKLDFDNAVPKDNNVSLHEITSNENGPIYHAGVDTIDGFCKSFSKPLTEEELDKAYVRFCELHPDAAQGGSGGAGQQATSEEDVIKLMQEDVPGHDYYNQLKKANLGMFQRGRIKIGENDKVVDPATRIEEWSEYGGKCKGMRKDGKQQGIVRWVGSNNI